MAFKYGARPPNIKILQGFQNLRIILDTPRYISNDTLHHDLNVRYVRDEIKRLSQRYIDRMEKWRILTYSPLIS